METLISIFPASWLLATLPLLSLFFGFFVYAFIWNYKWSYSMAAARNYKLPPNPPKLPIIGNLHQLLGKPRHEALWELSQKYGPIMLLHIGAKPHLVISSSSFAKQIFKNQDHIFCSRVDSRATKRISYDYSDVAFSPFNNHWKKMRKLLVTEFLGPKRAPLFRHVLVTQIQTMVRDISSHDDHVVNMSKVLMETVKAVVCKVAFGDKYREEPEKGPSWEAMLEETIEMLGGSIGDSFPWVGPLIDRFSGWNERLEKCFSNIDSYIDTIIDDHQSHENFGQVISDDDKDFVHSLLELSTMEHAAADDRLGKGDIKALIMDVLTGGIDTTVRTMVWAISEMVRVPRVMQKLQNEIRNCIGGGKQQQLVVNEIVDNITKMPYLKMVVKETLRLHPPAPLLIPHVSLSHCQIGGYDILPGTCALVNGWGIGRDPDTWGENATEFYPERFEKLNMDYGGGGNFEMAPFGGGRRSCPAMYTVPATVESVIANLLYWFDWEVPDGMKNEDLNMDEVGSLVVRRKLPLCLVPKKHNWED